MQEEKNKKILKKIKIKLIEQDLMVKDLAKEMGISKGFLSNILSGKKTLDKVQKGVIDSLARSLKTSTADLFY